MDSNEWELHKPTIERLYLEEGFTLQRVAAYMKRMHDFDKKKSQFEYKLAKWGVRKNATRDVWQYLRHQMQKREGRISEVTIRGRIIPEHKIRREMQRYTTIPTAREFQAGLPSPKTPEGDIIRVFKEQVPFILSWSARFLNSLFAPSEFSKVLHLTLGREATSHLQTVPYIPEAVSALIVNLARSVPEIGKGEGIKAQQVCNVRDMNSMATQLLVVLLFHLSNKLLEDMRYNEKVQASHDSLVIQLVEEISENNSAFLADLLRSRSHTSDAIKEAVYASAVRTSKCEIISQLLKAGVDPNLPVRMPTRISLTIERGKASIKWTSPGLFNPSGLEIAAYRLDTRLAVMLLEAGATIDQESTLLLETSILPNRALKETFVTACWAGDLETAEKLLDLDIDLNEGWELGITPLVATAWNPDNQLAKNLLRRGACVDPLNKGLASSSRRPSALHVAAFYGNTDLVQLLLDHGANLNLRFTPSKKEKILYKWLIPCDHTSPFQFALGSGDPATAALLYPQAEILGGELSQALTMRNEELVSALISRTPGILSSDQDGATVLEAAATSGNIRLITLFFSSGGLYRIDPTERQMLLDFAIGQGLVQRVREWMPLVEPLDFYFAARTPLQRAVENDSIVLVRLLIHAGAEVNAPAYYDSGVTALQAAAIRGNLDMATLLIMQKADVNAPAAKWWGRTALEAAAEHGRLDMVHFLLESGANLEGPMRIHYVRSIDFAMKQGHLAVAKYLKEYGDWTDRDQELHDTAGVLRSFCRFIYNEETQDWKIRRIKGKRETGDYYSVAYSDRDTDDDSYSESSYDTAEYANSSSQTESAILPAMEFTDETMDHYFSFEAFPEQPLEELQVGISQSTIDWVTEVNASAEEWDTTEQGAHWGPTLTEGEESFPDFFNDSGL
ncbi:hypothetical protein DL765_004967 [Monosporascus sp. GIB2]|nr:hypothetical protein DL765_004967 [Monosporascus sp. GIB2]